MSPAWPGSPQPFSGSAARHDGVASIQYRVAAQPDAQGCGRAPWLPELATEGYTPPGEALQRLVIEIDSGIESQGQLIQRAKGWRARWKTMPHLRATHTLILWLTTGTIERLNTIWEACIGHAFLPAFFATLGDLAAITLSGTRWNRYASHKPATAGSGVISTAPRAHSSPGR